MKAKVVDLEDKDREGFYMCLRKELIGIVKEVYGKMRFFLRFNYGFETDLNLIKITVITVYRSLVIKESNVTTIHGIPDETIDLDQG